MAASPPGLACAASASGTLTLGPVRTATGQTVLIYALAVSCRVTVLLASNCGLRYSFPCGAANCQGGYEDSPPASAGVTEVPYSLGVTDATGQSRILATAKGVPFGPPSPIPISPFPSPSR